MAILGKGDASPRCKASNRLAAASAGPDYATAIGLLMEGATTPPELLNPTITMAPVKSDTESWLSRLTRRWLQ